MLYSSVIKYEFDTFLWNIWTRHGCANEHCFPVTCEEAGTFAF